MRIPKTSKKPYTIQNEQTASVSDWLRCYPFMASQPVLWFSRHNWTAEDIARYPLLYELVQEYRHSRNLTYSRVNTQQAA